MAGCSLCLYSLRPCCEISPGGEPHPYLWAHGWKCAGQEIQGHQRGRASGARILAYMATCWLCPLHDLRVTGPCLCRWFPFWRASTPWRTSRLTCRPRWGWLLASMLACTVACHRVLVQRTEAGWDGQSTRAFACQTSMLVTHSQGIVSAPHLLCTTTKRPCLANAPLQPGCRARLQRTLRRPASCLRRLCSRLTPSSSSPSSARSTCAQPSR